MAMTIVKKSKYEITERNILSNGPILDINRSPVGINLSHDS